MSLNHLYLDLNHLGTYPDIIISTGYIPSGNIPNDNINNMIFFNIFKCIDIHTNKYYGPKLRRYTMTIFNKVVAWIDDTSLEVIKLHVNEVMYEIIFTSRRVIISCGEEMRKVTSIYHSIILREMLLVRYKEITDLDSLCEVFSEITN